MSNIKDNGKKNNIKLNDNDHLLGKKKEFLFFISNLKLDNHQSCQKICQFCNTNVNLIQCKKCCNYICLGCIKQIYHFQNYDLKENDYTCENCCKKEKITKKKKEFFCYICGQNIGGKNKYNYLVNKKQKLDFNYEFSNRCILLSEENEEIVNKQNDYSIIRICNKCHIAYSDLVENILSKNMENINIQKERKTNIFNKLSNAVSKKEGDINILNEKNDELDDKNDNIEVEISNKDSYINNENGEKLYEKEVNEELLNIFNNMKRFDNNSSKGKNRSKSYNKNSFTNSKNNKNMDFLNMIINKSILPSFNSNYLNMYDFNNLQYSYKDTKQNNFSNMINNYNNAGSLLPNLTKNNSKQFYNLNISPELKKNNNNNNLENNIFNFNVSKNNNLNNSNIYLNCLNNINEKINNLYNKFENKKIQTNQSNIFEKSDKNFLFDNIDKSVYLNLNGNIYSEDNIYFYLYRLKDALSHLRKYIVLFENNNFHYNNSILDNIEILANILSDIIKKIKNDIKNKNIFDNSEKTEYTNEHESKKENENINISINLNEKDKSEKKEGKKEESYEYYLKYVLNVNESFKNKIKILKIYTELKNNFLTILFKNIERLILKLSEIICDEPGELQKNEFFKTEEKEFKSSNNKNNLRFQFNNPPNININLLNNNKTFQNNNNFFNHYTPTILDLPNYDFKQSSYGENMPQILNSNNINRNISKTPEHKFKLNCPNVINNNFKYDLTTHQNGFGINPELFQNISSKSIGKKNIY